MDAGIATLFGVALGTGGTLLATRMSLQASSQQAADARREGRQAQVRELAADAYAASVEAIQWIGTHNVEDSVSPRFEAEYAPKTARALERLRYARELMGKVAALGGGQEFSKLTVDVVVALQTLDHSWHETQEYRRRLDSDKAANTSTGKLHDLYRRMFDENWNRLLSSRERLCGFDGSDLTREEIDAGSVREGSLLYRLRDMTSGQSLG
jgi:hypothetical protein